MPRSTVSHPFEWMVHAWAQRLRGGAGFVAIVGPTGDILRVHDGEIESFGNRCVSHTIMDAVTRDEPRWIFFDPFDWPEYAWLSWQGVSHATWQRLLADALSTAELEQLQRGRPLSEIPDTWGVMF